ncbi:HEAT repeat domain-containing protein [Belnapia rosea]|uniref:HEAT repeat-containing protein n=1 Tax=Belnapia rosea TaxID=938405 RepID=A0A1G7CZI1_9PROT|nr:HEAT repeat domain-containing protein [Belnapia rosea]SDE44190.1 HEAT repeat-containing protein [Belnapia rosea]
MPLIRRTPDGVQPDRPDAGEALATLTHGTRQKRWAAARALSDAPDAAEALGRALSSEDDPHVREAILTSLLRLRSAASIQAILPHLRSDNASLRTGALDALRAMPDVAGPHLPELLRDADPDVRLLACDLARSLRVADATHLLYGLLEVEREANICAAALDVLAEIGGPEALPVLARCAERFHDHPFLAFSIKVVTERLSAQTPRHRG